MSEKEYYNELVLQSYYHKLFDKEIEEELFKPLKKCIINSFTGFSGGCFGGHEFVDDNNNKVRVLFEVTKNNESKSLMEENNDLKRNISKIEEIIQDLMYEYNEKYEFGLNYIDKSFNKARTVRNIHYFESGISVLIHLLSILQEENILQED